MTAWAETEPGKMMGRSASEQGEHYFQQDDVLYERYV